jgi:hypothetical protein
MWQKRLLDHVPTVDFTGNEPGVTVVLTSAKVVTCPACQKPGIVESYEHGDIIAHKHDRDGITVDCCVPQPQGAPELILFDSEGKPAYSGPAKPAAGTEN